MILVAISLVSLLAMAALAIDVVTLYVARSEIQRAADAAALAGAKAVADSGVTTLPPGDTNLTNGLAQQLARNMAASAVTAMLNANPPINQVAGQTITPTTSVTFPGTANPTNSNPYVTVTLKVTTLPTFFSRIWGNTAATVSATAAAEAYNPANVQNFIPIAPKGVKPWLVANVDPNNGGAPFVNPITGVVETNTTPYVIGETLNLTADCPPPGPGCTLAKNPGLGSANTGGYPQVQYLPALVTPDTTGSNICPSVCQGTTAYEQSIECADMTTSYQVLSCGGGSVNAQWDASFNPGGVGGQSDLGTECLIHATAPGRDKGQDKLDPSPWPNNPMQISAQSGAQNGNDVTTSNSIVTIPILDVNSTIPPTGGAVTIDGYIQAFVEEVHGPGNPSHAGDIKVTVLNIAGCGSASTNLAANPIIGAAGTSPVPVRLITHP
jgi:hypothetical protein